MEFPSALDGTVSDTGPEMPQVRPLSIPMSPTQVSNAAVGQSDSADRSGASMPEFIREELLHDLFEETAAIHPQRTAVVDESTFLTYQELDHQSNQLAAHLNRQGIGRGSFVGLLLPRSGDVYVALLAILKAGAAYVPLDPEYPEDRVQYILSDVGAAAVLTCQELSQKVRGSVGKVLELDAMTPGFDQGPDSQAHTRPETQPTDPAYVIYTSGSTGRPKGVIIQHRSACHLVRAEGWLFAVQPTDRVYQGFSIAFDASVEEIWLAFHSGAALVVGTSRMVHSGAGLADHLSAAGVTVLSTVPTQLSMMNDTLPGVRLLIVGGESCPSELVRRWTRPGRRMVNTYGPTEATVIVTAGDLQPDQPVTIGRPIPNCRIVLIDEQLKPVAQGAAGEIAIGGICLARGYIGREELTREKFIVLPGAGGNGDPQRLYRSGDLGRWTSTGEIEFLGRADSQVKLRGFRIELSEIESALCAYPGIRAATATVVENESGVQQLVAYFIPAEGQVPAEDAIRKFLALRLPRYMVPAIFESTDTFPTLPSGKVDRRSLPPLRQRSIPLHEVESGPTTELEKYLLSVWTVLFHPQPVSIRDNFFLDLGGHSLVAARLVNELRQKPGLEAVSMLDVYEHPTIEELAQKYGGIGSGSTRRTDKPDPFEPVPSLRHFLCGCAQFGGLYFVLGFLSLQWLAPYLAYVWMVDQEAESWEALLAAFGILVSLYPLMLLASIAIKWIVVGRYQAGKYPLWGSYFWRCWLVNTIQSAIPISYLEGTPLLNLYLRAMGARIGTNVHVATTSIACHDLVEIGDNSCVGLEAALPGYRVERGSLIIGGVQIGRNCFIGARAVLRESTRMEDNTALEDLSLLPAGETIPKGERWVGSPARKTGRNESKATVDPTQVSTQKQFAFTCLHALGVVVFPSCVLAAVMPGMMLMNELNYDDDYYWYLLFSPLVSLSFVILLGAEIAAIKWIVLGRIRPGTYPVQSFFYIRKWFVDQLMSLSLDFLGPLYASIYLTPWYRLLGARIGHRAEISTASFISPDLLAIGDESFVADDVSLGAARLEAGFVRVGKTTIGQRSFIGNSALLPPGCAIGDDCLIGCLSVPPTRPEDAVRPGNGWIGSPAVHLPQRQQSAEFPVEQTFRPTTALIAQRAAIEFVRVILPSTGFIMLTSLLFSAVVLLEEYVSLGTVLLLFPFLYAGCGALAVTFLAVLKWTLMGRYRAGEKPLWSGFVWRNELINAVQEHLANALIVDVLKGTPFICWFFRLLGSRIGKRVYLDTTDITEHDLVEVGSDVAINADCTLQTHLFEDRVMKMSKVVIGDRCTVGSRSLVLYDTEMEPDSALNDLSLLMKGEVLPRGTHWEGTPARAELPPKPGR